MNLSYHFSKNSQASTANIFLYFHKKNLNTSPPPLPHFKIFVTNICPPTPIPPQSTCATTSISFIPPIPSTLPSQFYPHHSRQGVPSAPLKNHLPFSPNCHWLGITNSSLKAIYHITIFRTHK